MTTAAGQLTVRNVSKTFVGDDGAIVTALDDVSFAVAERELVALVGPSGSGKTTLLSIAAGLTEPSSGAVLVGDDLVRGPGPARGVVLQTATVFPWMSVRANIEFALRGADLARAERRRIADAQLELVGLAALADARPDELPGDRRPRVALARALAQEPVVLLIDEPFAVLEASVRPPLRELLRRVRDERGLTVLVATRDADEAALLADRVLPLAARVPGGVG